LIEHFNDEVGVGVGELVGDGAGVGDGDPPVGGTDAAAGGRPVVALDERDVEATVGLPIVKVLGSVDVDPVALSSHAVWLVPSVVFPLA
jgi:hypothetical protein